MNYLLICFVLAFIGLTFAETCNVNEEFKECGTACSPTCADQRETRPCNRMCVRGCFCMKPFIRNQLTGECVRIDQCPQTCTDSNEVFTGCGTACPTTCSNMNQTGRVCTMQCVQGCFCQEPYVRDETTGKCVLREQCLQRQVCSDPNEVFKSCGTDCPLTCKNFANPPALCDKMCKIGCFCDEPYVRDETTGRCVATKDCTE